MNALLIVVGLLWPCEPLEAQEKPADTVVLPGFEAPAKKTAAPLMGIGTKKRSIDVEPDPQSGILSSVDYPQEDGGLIEETNLGNTGDSVTPPAAPLPHYNGIVPGMQENADPFDKFLDQKQNYLTWLGYQSREDRVFFQTARPVDYTISRGPKGELYLDLHHVRIASGNNTLPLNLEHFPTSVGMVFAKRLKKKDVRLTIVLKEPSPYRVERRGRFLYVAFGG